MDPAYPDPSCLPPRPPPFLRLRRRGGSHHLAPATPADEPIDWLIGNDPEADTKRAAERRTVVRKRVIGAGAQLVLGLVILFVASALVILAITDPRRPVIIAAAVFAPPGLWYAVFRWRRWLGQAPYIYRLLKSLGEVEDAELYLAEYRNRKLQRAQTRMNRQPR